MSQPAVFVILVNWNRKDDTLECLHSLANVTYPRMHIVLVDNASTDDSVANVKQEFPSVDLIRNRSNLRFAGGNNVGIAHALGKGADYVLLLNNDTVVDPDFLTRLVNTAEQAPTNGMVGGKIYYYGDRNRIWYAGGRIEWWKGWISHIGLREEDRGQHDKSAQVDYITGCCLLVKRLVIETVGMLDERFFMYGEDVDWCLRAQRVGFHLLYEPGAKVWHKLSASSGGHFSWYKNWNKLRSTLRLAARYANPFQWVTIPVMLPLCVLWQFVGMSRHRRSR